MKTSAKSALMKGVGIAAAALVPAVVVAQSLPSFGAGNVLRAGDLQALSNNLSDALARLTALEDRVGAAVLSKGSVYDSAVVSTPVAVGAVADSTASCADESDILINCSCLAAAGSRTVDMYLIQIIDNQNPAAASRCLCTGENVGSVANSVSARASCLRLP